MQKTKLLVISVLAAVLLSSSVISLAAAQDSIPPATPDLSASIDPEAEDKADETQIIDEGNSTSPDAPITSDDEILYTIQDDNSTDINSCAEPYEEDAQIYATGAQNSSDNTLIVAAIGVILAVVVGGVIGVVYFRKQVAKAKN
jgi:hypothetical protein